MSPKEQVNKCATAQKQPGEQGGGEVGAVGCLRRGVVRAAPTAAGLWGAAARQLRGVWVSARRISASENISKGFSSILRSQNARHRELQATALFFFLLFFFLIGACLVMCLFPVLLTMGFRSPLWGLSIIHLMAVSDVSALWYSKSLV